MKFNILESREFKKSLKKLSKKYKKLVYNYEKLINILEECNPKNAIKISENIYKIRLQNSSHPKGKSGGFRVVYFIKTTDNIIYLLDIFSKNEIDTIQKSKIIEIANNYFQ